MLCQASRATTASMPVPTIGAVFWINGTAWRCMFEPIRVLFASSCSKNGISEAATPITIPLHKSIKLTSSRLANKISPFLRVSIKSSFITPLASKIVEAGAM